MAGRRLHCGDAKDLQAGVRRSRWRPSPTIPDIRGQARRQRQTSLARTGGAEVRHQARTTPRATTWAPTPGGVPIPRDMEQEINSQSHPKWYVPLGITGSRMHPFCPKAFFDRKSSRAPHRVAIELGFTTDIGGRR